MGNKLKEKLVNNKINEYKYIMKGFSKLYVEMKAIELFYDVSSYPRYKEYCEGLYNACSHANNLCSASALLTNNVQGKINNKLEQDTIKEAKNIIYNENLFIYIIRYGLNMDKLESVHLPNYRNEKVYIPVVTNPFQEFLEVKLNIVDNFVRGHNIFRESVFFKHSNDVKKLNESLKTQTETMGLKNCNDAIGMKEIIENCKLNNKELAVNLLDYEDLKATLEKQFNNINRSCDITEQLIEKSKAGNPDRLEVATRLDKIKQVRNEQVAILEQKEEDFYVGNSLGLKSPTEWAVPLELKK